MGPYVWHEFDAERTRAEFQAIASAGFRVVRTLLPWDVFMPRIARVGSHQLADFETMLAAAEQADIAVVPVLFAQSLGDCVMLPPYAIDVDAPRLGVRCISDGVVQPGGPRDQYTDPRMIEAELLWLGAMLDAFGGNPVIRAWDLGHDPASTVRPRRIEQLREWVAMLASDLHQRGERCVLTLGGGDVRTARGVRLDAVAPSVDALGLSVDAQALPLNADRPDVRALAFTTQLALRLAGQDVSLHVHVAATSGASAGDAEAGRARRFAGDAVGVLLDVGCSGIHAGTWSDCSARVAKSAPFDRHPELASRGVVAEDDEPTPFGEAWTGAIAVEQERRAAQPWPDVLDTHDYYANLPHSVDDLFAAWQRVANDHPGMLG
ncbi:MAG: hypothetical protein ABR498_00025 [Candidatus Dormibacteria bacterium]